MCVRKYKTSAKVRARLRPRSSGESEIGKFATLWSTYGPVGSFGRCIRRLKIEGPAVSSFSTYAPYQWCPRCVRVFCSLAFRLAAFFFLLVNVLSVERLIMAAGRACRAQL